jgi:hypothetical protein
MVGEFLPDALLGEHVNNNPERPAGACKHELLFLQLSFKR